MKPGKYIRTKATLRRMSASIKRKFREDPEYKERNHQAQLAAAKKPENRLKISLGKMGKPTGPRTKASCKKESISMKKKYREDPEWAARRKVASIIANRDPLRCQRVSEGQKGKVIPDWQKKMISASLKKFHRTHPELGLLFSEKRKSWFKNNPFEAGLVIEALMRGNTCARKPNKPEKQLWSVLDKNFPGLFTLNCQKRGRRKIGNKFPDFICESKKVIVEMFGDYWHGEEFQGRPKEVEEKLRKDHFRKCGYRTVIIWHSELRKNLALVISRIRRALKIKKERISGLKINISTKVVETRG